MGSVGDITAALGPMELISIMAANAVIQEQAGAAVFRVQTQA